MDEYKFIQTASGEKYIYISGTTMKGLIPVANITRIIGFEYDPNPIMTIVVKDGYESYSVIPSKFMEEYIAFLDK